MANSTKITQKMAINYVMDNFELPKEYKDKFNDMLTALEKKSASKKMTKGQEENEILKANILEVMENDTKYRVGDIMKLVGLESSQKTSALVRQLKESGLVERTVEKGVAYFTKA